MPKAARTPLYRDVFAKIARDGSVARMADPQPQSQRGADLVAPDPPTLPDVSLPGPTEGARSDLAFSPTHKLDSPAKLQCALTRMRRQYAKFLRNLAPVPALARVALQIEEFDWRVETAADRADFLGTLQGAGEWTRVRIPHYGGPLGRAVTYYRITFDVTEAMLGQGSLWVCFQGVDYKAHAFLNGAYLGSHEGFFGAFAFDGTAVTRSGANTLLVKVENDAICMGNDSWGEDGALYDGDKLYAATGPGYDDPEVGWHHCPPGMGIYQSVTIEARPPVHIRDIFVRPLLEEQRAEAWIEVWNAGILRRDVALRLSLYGQNFRQTLFRDRLYALPGPVGPGVNYFRLPIELPGARVWDLETPWLYQLQATVADNVTGTADVAVRQFGMRSFRMEEDVEPRGRLYLNGRQIRLRGANTMGHEQQCVIKRDWAQLRDDILLAKLCHMNFLRLTQRPVQAEVYEHCDRLGLMTQTDLPLFAVLRRNQYIEAVRQAEEMERLVRAHPCNIMVSYINEPFPGAQDKPHRHLTRPELESFFVAANEAVRLANPDRVIKPVDGDYDPPAPGLPDNHCYCGWYNGHGVDLGKLHKGYWQKVKPGWLYGCGEFGAEGLDPVNTMRRFYPPSWLPQPNEDESTWTPDRIVKAQTGRFHYMWFDTQHTLAHWVAASQAHQAWVTRLMTEAFRRDSRMTSIAIHLGIDAFPSGWMKTLLDVQRQPKPAYFAYREALTPIMANLRTDRYAFFAGETVAVEAWVCNDLDHAPEGCTLHYQLERAGKVLAAQGAPAHVPVCASAFQGILRLAAPVVVARELFTLRLGLLDAEGHVLHDTALALEVFPASSAAGPKRRALVVGAPDGKASHLVQVLDLLIAQKMEQPDVILVDDLATFQAQQGVLLRAVERGATAVFLELAPGEHALAGDKVSVMPCGMNPRHFASRATGHALVADLQPHDLRFWYDEKEGYVTPLLATTFSAVGWTPILTSGNGDWASGWGPSLAAAEKPLGRGILRICQVALAYRVQTNPAARVLAERLVRG